MLFQRRASLAALSLASLASLAVVTWEGTASAKGKIGIDVEGAVPTDTPDDDNIDTGWGAGLRLGHQWDLLLLNLTPEFGFHYTQFSGDANMTAWNILAGGRVGIGFILQPSVFAHAGLGHYGFDSSTARDTSQTSMAYDFGAALDLTALPIVDIGAHVTWNGIAGDSDMDPLNWVAIGGHLAFTVPGL